MSEKVLILGIFSINFFRKFLGSCNGTSRINFTSQARNFFVCKYLVFAFLDLKLIGTVRTLVSRTAWIVRSFTRWWKLLKKMPCKSGPSYYVFRMFQLVSTAVYVFTCNPFFMIHPRIFSVNFAQPPLPPPTNSNENSKPPPPPHAEANSSEVHSR